jgi:large subunit ribosomal protein L15
MIKLEDLHGDNGMKQQRKRVGRGESSGQGKTSGRGHKGAGARTGFNAGSILEGGQTTLARRIPKRGFSNLPWSIKTKVVNLNQINAFEDGATVDHQALAEAGIVSSKIPRIKILSVGELTKKFTVVAHAFSASAIQKIEAAGGTCQIIGSSKTDEEAK